MKNLKTRQARQLFSKARARPEPDIQGPKEAQGRKMQARASSTENKHLGLELQSSMDLGKFQILQTKNFEVFYNIPVFTGLQDNFSCKKIL